MENQVQETGTERLKRLREEARELGIVGQMTGDQFEAAIKAKKEGLTEEPTIGVAPPTDAKYSLTPDEAAKIDAKLKYEFEAQEKMRHEITMKKDRASIVAESESLDIEIDLPENPTELQLAKARRMLGMKKEEVKPSPETIGIEASKKGYYTFRNLEQEDAAHTANPGGKYTINLIPDQIHVLSEYHIKFFRKKAVKPVYARVSTGNTQEGAMGEECKRTGNKQRWSFEHHGEAPQDAPFGLVTDMKILKELRQEEILV